MSRALVICILFVGLIPAVLTAQNVAQPFFAAASSETLISPSVDAAPLPAQAASADSPQAPMAERDMRPYWHVFIAFALVWILILGYAVSVRRRFGRLEEEVQRLEKS